MKFNKSNRSLRNMIATLHDVFMAGISFILAVYIRLGDEQIGSASPYLALGTAIFTLVCMAVFLYMRLYRGSWRYSSMRDLSTIVKAVTLSILIFALLMFLINRHSGLPRSVLFINWMLLLVLLGAPRFIYRSIKDHTLDFKSSLDEIKKIPVLLIGAGDAAEQFIRNSQRNPCSPYEVAGLVDDNPAQKGRTIHRINIYGNSEIIPIIVKKLERKGRKPQKLIISDEEVSSSSMNQLLDISDNLGIPLARLPKLSEFKQGVTKKNDIRPIAIEDLLGRSQNILDRKAMRELIEGKKILITGAGGTIGGELARQIASYNPKKLVIVENSELNMYQIERELQSSFPYLSLNCILGNVRDITHIENIFENHLPELVFHAAAIKHVPIAEYNIEETILTNVFGSRNVAEACLKYKAQAMVMISTDKAVNPTNVMGASKRLAESFCQALGRQEQEDKVSGQNTKFITVRFGNVLGSTGSVVPLFNEQLSRGGPITVTDAEMTRYFMTVREAVELVLQASVLGRDMQDKQEYIFVLDMGKPMKILDLALQMIKLAGLKPYIDIDIIFTGLRPGEKLYEELFHLSENVVETANKGIFLASPRQTDLKTLKKSFISLHEACKARKSKEALESLKNLVPEFTPRT
ncbi:MAG: nucleoside-diphosphate sugar epimerase/dehydratase [Rickettsiales bacterium]|jgi:FlaA1/EpsC-like NDP-sugar epimerase